MITPLFKHPEKKLSPREEAEIIQELANAYRQNEIGGNQPALLRIVENVEKRFFKKSVNERS
jgi:hypothetical protein